MYALTIRERELLRWIGGGIDVFDPLRAMELQHLAQAAPEYLITCEALGTYYVGDMHPFFGVSLTQAGKEAAGLEKI